MKNNKLKIPSIVSTTICIPLLIYALLRSGKLSCFNNKQSDVYETLNNNTIIDDEYKTYIENYIEKLLKYDDKIDLSLLNERLKTIKFEIRDEIGNVAANYNIEKNIITLDLNNEFDDSIYHELLHVTTIEQSDIHYGLGFYEGVTEILNGEIYCNDELQRAYYFTRRIVKQLTIIVGREKIEEIFFYGNISDLENELVNILDDRTKAKTLISKIDNIRLQDSNKEYEKDTIKDVSMLLLDYYEIVLDKKEELTDTDLEDILIYGNIANSVCNVNVEGKEIYFYEDYKKAYSSKIHKKLYEDSKKLDRYIELQNTNEFNLTTSIFNETGENKVKIKK